MTCVLKDLIELSKDGEWGEGEPFADSVEMLCVRGTDFEDVRFGNLDSVPRRYVPKRIAAYKTLRPWDLVIETAGGTKGQITGRTILLRPRVFARVDVPVTCASFSRFLRFRADCCDPEFMFWYLQYLYGAGFLDAYHTQHTGVSRFQWTTFAENEPLDLPEFRLQRRIAGILSAYDELIENNLRRIRIAEEMARALYREWFIEFRFPSHENVGRVSSSHGSIPGGWEGHFGDLASIERAGINPYEFPSEEFDHYSIPAFDDGRRAPVELGESILSGKYAIDASVVLLSKLNPRIPRVWLPEPSGERRAITSTEFLVLRPLPGITREFLYAKCCSEEFGGQFGSLAIGTSTSHQRVKPDNLLAMPSVVPDPRTVQRFSLLAGPILKLGHQLRVQTLNLRRTRDLLLPRFFSGQLTLKEAVA